jgi:hypothetical protein
MDWMRDRRCRRHSRIWLLRFVGNKQPDSDEHQDGYRDYQRLQNRTV